MDVNVVLRVVAFIGAVVVGLSALQSLVAEWPKRGLDDHVTKVMLALLALGCCIVVLVVFGVLPGIQGPTPGS
jgi:NADH:ubiquinone oxidoreductase subunit 6 (subunit J)